MTLHVASFSGGKDSTAVILWLREQGIEHKTVFCDTGWEHELTYDFVRYLDDLLGLGVEWLKSEKYPGGFEQLVVERNIIPGVRSRFCTDELKVRPLHNWIERQEDGDVVMYQGIRREESLARSVMPAISRMDEAGGYEIRRPILEWTAEQVFDIHRRHGVKPHAFYALYGMSRVGCMPCIMANKRELRQIAERFPEVRDKLERLEEKINEGREPEDRRSFFRADYIPERLMRTHKVKTKDGRTVPVPSIKEVFDYVTKEDMKQLSLIDDPPAKCLSVYNLCE